LYQGKITIGVVNWSGNLAFFIARDKGYFQQAGLDVEIKKYPALGQISRDYLAGLMQGRANITPDVLRESGKGMDHRVVLAIDESSGADAIIARTEIASEELFRGKRIGFEPDTLEEFFLRWELNKHGMTLSDIVAVAVGPDEAPELLINGAIDVAVSHEPYISQLTKSSDFRVLYSSAEDPGIVMDVLTFRADFIKSYPETIQTLIDVYFKAVQFWKDHPNEAYVIGAKEFGDTPEVVAKQLEQIKIFDLRDNKTVFTYAAGFQSIYGNLRAIRNFMSRNKPEDANAVDTNELVDRTFIKRKDE
jgi:NitT/TauT family transport system substrate-binding protein